MAIIKRRVYDTLLDPLGQPLVGVVVEAKLVDAAFYRPDPSLSILPLAVSTTTDENGYWFLDLIPNALLAPRGNYYIFKILNKFFYVWIPADSTEPIALSEVIVGEHDICQTDLPGLQGIKAEGHPPLRGVVTLKQGIAITLEQDYDNRTITIHGREYLPGTEIDFIATGPFSYTIHGRKYLPGTEIDIVTTDPFSYTIHGRRIVGEQGISVTPRPPYDRVVTPVYGTEEVVPIAPQSNPGSLDKIARIDHTHEGIHSINNLLGDVSLLADVGINLLTDAVNNRILVANDPHQVVFGKEFDIIQVRGASSTGYGVGWFNADLGFVSGWTARRSDNNQDITDILTDNNTSTGITIDSSVSVIISLPQRMAISQLIIFASNPSFQVSTELLDENGNAMTTAYAQVMHMSGDWYQAVFWREAAIADRVVIRIFGYYYSDHSENGSTTIVSEVRVKRGILFRAPFAFTTSTDIQDVLLVGNIYLREGFTYRMRAFWGMGDYLADLITTQYPQISGNGFIIYPNGVEASLGSFGWKGSQAPPYHNSICVHTATLTPPVTGFATVYFHVRNRPQYVDYEHAYFLGLILQPNW